MAKGLLGGVGWNAALAPCGGRTLPLWQCPGRMRLQLTDTECTPPGPSRELYLCPPLALLVNWGEKERDAPGHFTTLVQHDALRRGENAMHRQQAHFKIF